ncbi:MAG: DUF2135 domain-containing protein [Gammaproteobacteria bacterium]|nr:DUF2135 domain-containing protein [Gammaproteobacteria bacterium]
MKTNIIPAFMLMATTAATAQVVIELPIGGWRASGSEDTYTQTVNYPASTVNTPSGVSNAARIKGKINQRDKNSEPATLIVNGTAMPLRVDPAGNFERPYAFSSGSNNVEVRDTNGDRQRVQFYDVSANKKQARLRVLLSWDSDGSDLDLHVITPTGEHAWYGQRVIPSGGAIDVDVTTGYGPEIFSHPAPQSGLYLVYVNYYGGGQQASDELTTAQVAIVSNENTPNEKRQLFQVPMRRTGDLTLINSFMYP